MTDTKRTTENETLCAVKVFCRYRCRLRNSLCDTILFYFATRNDASVLTLKASEVASYSERLGAMCNFAVHCTTLLFTRPD